MIQHQRVHQSVDRARSQLTTVRVQTHRDTSEFPTSGGVSHVTAAEEIADIEADFERALQLWKVTEALQQGYLQSGIQLISGISHQTHNWMGCLRPLLRL